jgi:hypothetical protein
MLERNVGGRDKPRPRGVRSAASFNWRRSSRSGRRHQQTSADPDCEPGNEANNEVMGDYRTYDYVVGLRAVTSTDSMTADFYPFDMKFIAHVATRIVNEVKGVNVEAAGHDRVGVTENAVVARKRVA